MSSNDLYPPTKHSNPRDSKILNLALLRLALQNGTPIQPLVDILKTTSNFNPKTDLSEDDFILYSLAL